MRRALAIAVLGAWVGVACGGSQEQEVVRRTGITYLDAVLRGDHDRACSVMSTTLRAEVIRQSRRSGRRARDCAPALERILSLGPSRRKELERQRQRAESATIVINQGSAVMGGGQAGATQAGDYLFFIREGGDWKLHPKSPG